MESESLNNEIAVKSAEHCHCYDHGTTIGAVSDYKALGNLLGVGLGEIELILFN